MTNIKVIEKLGKLPGVTTIILAGIHGNEICGVKALDEIIPDLKIEKGRVIFIYANLEAIKQNKRYIEKNLNRCFFKNQSKEIKNTLEGKTAKEIIPYLEIADFVLDIHSSNNPETMPFVICDEKQIEKSILFDCEIVSYNWDPFEPGSTDYYMNILEKPGFCLECGYVKDKNAIKFAKKSILNFLRFTGNIYGNIFYKKGQKLIKIKNSYINKINYFKKVRPYSDFEKSLNNEIIGYEGKTPIFIEQGDIILFLTDREILNTECFLIAEEINKETLINKPSFLKRKNPWEERTKSKEEV